MSSQLSIARWTGACRINGHVYHLDRRSQCLVRSGYDRFLKPLGIKVLKKADKRYGTGRKSISILSRMQHIISTQKRLQKQKEEPTIFNNL